MKLLAVTVLVLAAGAAGWFIARRPEHAVSLGAPPRQVTTSATVERTGTLPSGTRWRSGSCGRDGSSRRSGSLPDSSRGRPPRSTPCSGQPSGALRRPDDQDRTGPPARHLDRGRRGAHRPQLRLRERCRFARAAAAPGAGCLHGDAVSDGEGGSLLGGRDAGQRLLGQRAGSGPPGRPERVQRPRGSRTARGELADSCPARRSRL